MVSSYGKMAYGKHLNRKLKRYIYLISPQRIKGVKFYKELHLILKTNKIEYFQLRLKKKKEKLFIKIMTKKLRLKLQMENVNYSGK